MRVGMLLQLLWSDGAAHPDEALDTLKELHTPVAKLHNWNALLPRLKARGAEVDADMKVLIVAGDADIVVDVLEQLRVADRRVKAVLRRKDEISQPATAGAASSVAHFLAFCCQQQLQMSWARSLEMARSPGHKQLAALQRGGEAGNFAAVVRWCKLAFAHCKHLCTLCAVDPAEADLALGAAGGGLASRNSDVVLWTARLLQRMAADLTERGCALYERYLGLTFVRMGGERLRLVFTNVDERDTSRAFSFEVFVDGADRYHVEQCEPSVPSMPQLLDRLNTNNDFGAFVRAMRAGFKDLC